MSVPLKKERERCWNFRDKYWKCLDKNNDDKEKCLEMRKEFENYCSKQWVSYALKKHVNFLSGKTHILHCFCSINNKYVYANQTYSNLFAIFRCNILIEKGTMKNLKQKQVYQIGIGLKVKRNK